MLEFLVHTNFHHLAPCVCPKWGFRCKMTWYLKKLGWVSCHLEIMPMTFRPCTVIEGTTRRVGLVLDRSKWIESIIIVYHINIRGRPTLYNKMTLFDPHCITKWHYLTTIVNWHVGSLSGFSIWGCGFIKPNSKLSFAKYNRLSLRSWVQTSFETYFCKI